MRDIKDVKKKVLTDAKKEIIFKVITSVLIRGLLLVIPILYSMTVDDITAGNYTSAYIITAISIVVYLIYRLSEHYNQVAYYKLYNNLFSGYSDIALNQTHNNSIFSLSRFSLGEYSNILNNDIDIMASYYTNLIIRIVQILEFLVIFVYFFTINSLIFFITLGLCILMLVITIKSGKKTQELSKIRKDDLDRKTALNHEFFKGIKEIKSYNIFNKVYKKFTKATDNYLNSNADYNIQFNFIKFVVLFILEIARLIVFGYGIYLISKGQLELGVLLIIYNYYQKIIDNFTTISAINVEFRNLVVSEERFNKILEFSSDYNRKDEKIEIKNIEGKVIFNNILYGYRDDPTLDHVSFEIPPTSITSITGKENSGKEGVAHLLLKLNRQHEGNILIDHIDINNYNDSEYYHYIACASRQPFFFNASIKENLMMVANNEEDITKICETLKINDDIETLNKGYNTIINSDEAISTNMQLMLSIARVLLKNPKIMIFDNIIDLLDYNNQKIVLSVLKKLKKEHTIIIITREPNIINASDKVIHIGEDEKENTKKTQS